MKTHGWKIAFLLLFVCWVIGAALAMARVRGGFLTNYLADLTFPPWFYINIRGLASPSGRRPNLLLVKDWFGTTPHRAFTSILLVGIISEIMTWYWPTGIIRGTFDFLDIAAYAVGLLVCYAIDLKNQPA